MAPKVTSSSNRSARKPAKPKPITTSKGRGNRSSVSQARVTNDTTRPPNGSGGARVTNASGRGVEPSSARVTGGTPASTPLTRRSRVNGRVVAGPDPRGNRPPVSTAKPPVKPSGTFKAPTIPKPSAKPQMAPSTRGGTVRGAIRTGVGVAGATALLAPIAAEAVKRASSQDFWNQKSKEYRDYVAQGEAAAKNRGTRTGTSSGRTGRGGTTADARTSTAAKPRVSNIPPSEGTGRGGPSDIKRTQPKPPTRSNGGNPPAPGSSRRQPSSGGGSSAPSRPSRPQTSSGTAGKGQQWADFNPNRGTSKTNNPLIKNDSWMMDRMKAREDAANKKFDTKSDVYTPKTKVDGSGLDTKKIDQKKVDEYKRRKNRYYD